MRLTFRRWRGRHEAKTASVSCLFFPNTKHIVFRWRGAIRLFSGKDMRLVLNQKTSSARNLGKLVRSNTFSCFNNFSAIQVCSHVSNF